MQAGRPDELRQTLKELGMKKLGHREKLLSALL
jgi:ribosomal protein L30/L7E